MPSRRAISSASRAVPATLPQETSATGACGSPSTTNRSLRRFSGSSLWIRLSFIRACTSPLAVGAPRSLCSMPEAR